MATVNSFKADVRALVLRQIEWKNWGCVCNLYAENGFTLLVPGTWSRKKQR